MPQEEGATWGFAHQWSPDSRLVLSTAVGELVERRDSTESELRPDCPFLWESDSAVLPRPDEDCVVEPD